MAHDETTVPELAEAKWTRRLQRSPHQRQKSPGLERLATEQRARRALKETAETRGTRTALSPSWQTRILHRLHPARGADNPATLHSQEQRTSKDYVKQQPRRHGRDSATTPPCCSSSLKRKRNGRSSTLARIEGRHRGAGGNPLARPMLGANNGSSSTTTS